MRTPARIDRDVYQNSGSIVIIGGGPNVKDETLTAYELGFRTEVRSRLSASVSAFYNDYQRLRTIELSPSGTIPAVLAGRSGFLPITFVNNMQGSTYGVAALPDPAVPGYSEADLRLAWQAPQGLELSLVGVNLLHARHREFGTASVAPRHVKVSTRLRF